MRFAAQATSQQATITKNLVEAAGVELSRVVCDDERLLHAQQLTPRRVTTRSRQFRPVGQQLGSGEAASGFEHPEQSGTSERLWNDPSTQFRLAAAPISMAP
jgi:hypothetical protein